VLSTTFHPFRGAKLELLVDKVKNERVTKGYIGLGTYEAIIYWKLYSQPAATKNVCAKIRKNGSIQLDINIGLKGLGEQLPMRVTEDCLSIMHLYDLLDQYGPMGYTGLINPQSRLDYETANRD
jgi:hypothetical protein